LEEKVNRRSGISLLDVVILILIVGIIAAILIPKTRLQKAEQSLVKCRAQMMAISDAMLKFYTTRGDTSLLNIGETGESEDTTAGAEAETTSTKEELKPHLFTDDTTLLRPYLPEEYSFTCPLDGDPYVIIVRDSIFYSISCPNGEHGQVIKGQATWNE